MERDDTHTSENEDGSRRNATPARQRNLATRVVVALLIVALGAAVVAAFASRSAAWVGARGAARLAPTPTPGVSEPQAPIRGAGLPAGAEVTTFALTGPDEGWATAAININPVTTAPDRGVVLRYSAGVLTQVGPALPGAFLSRLTMDSPTEGWVTGEGGNGKGLLLHISGGTWSRAPLPAIDPVGWPEIVYAPTPDESWMVMGQSKFAQGGAFNVLLHERGGVWSLVVNTPHEITDIAPVVAGKAWVIGINSDGSSSLVLVQGGAGTVTLTSPPYSALTRLRMFGPDNIWIEGAIHAASNNEVNDQPLAYHYDGATWKRVDVQAPHHAQHITIVGPDTVWSYTSYESAAAVNGADRIDSIYSNAGGHWRTLNLPYANLQSLTVVSSSSADVWAISVYWVMTQVTNAAGPTYENVSHSMLLHYTGGVWTEWGR